MPESSSGGFELLPLTDRLLFLIYPPEDVAARIDGFAREKFQQLGIRGKSVSKERLHITLHHLGDYASFPDEIRDQAIKVGAAAMSKSFQVTFNRLMTFTRHGNNPIVLTGGSTALRIFHQALGLDMRRTGLKRFAVSGFTPHITLRYSPNEAETQTVEDFTWTVREFHLVHSLLGQTQHRILQTWKLQD
jgi:2'-5' RNA ligase